MGAKVIHIHDDQIVEGCRRQDRDSQRMLYEKYYDTMSWVCYRYLKDKMLVEDLVHEGFLKVFRNINKYDHKGSLEGWMRRVMVNCCLDYLRRQKRVAGEVELTQASDQEVDTDIVAGMQANYILELIQQLPAVYRMVFNLNVIEGYPHREIAEKLDIKESTSRAYLTEAKKQLRTLLVQAGAGLERKIQNS
ncbi:MAG: sigma-70 family RNA polymerase sigma factor [Bacteroidetes bacterium]|nr:MAG: sigma-70 family RNA polymerase sigma factor [Bacteroidota bacterium]